MNPKNIALVALDILREAVFSKYLIVLFGLIALGLVGLALSLDFEVVDGAIAAGRLFGNELSQSMFGGRPMMASEALRPIFQVMAYATFYLGLMFMIVAVADIAPKTFAPGRVEFYLSLPLSRTELVLGTYVGVLTIASSALCFAVGGGVVVLFIKAEVFSVAPLLGAGLALIAFTTLYGMMLLVTTVARSAALSAGAAFILYVLGMATSDRATILSLMKAGLRRDVVDIAMGPLPRLHTLATFAGEVAKGATIHWPALLSVVGGCLALSAFCVAVACAVVNARDY